MRRSYRAGHARRPGCASRQCAQVGRQASIPGGQRRTRILASLGSPTRRPRPGVRWRAAVPPLTGDVLAARLTMSQPVRDALACTFERWNGKGQPNGVKGERIPLAMRIVHLTHDAEALARLRSPAEAIALIRERSGRAYDPGLVAEFLPAAAGCFGRLDKLDPWDAVDR